MTISIRKLKNSLGLYVLVMYIILLTGSAYQNAYMSALAKFNMLVMYALIAWIGIIKRQLTTIPKNVVSFFIAYGIFNMFYCMVAWNEIDYYNLYISNFSFIVVAIIIAKKIPYQSFYKAFQNLMLVLAAISLVLFLIPEIKAILPSFTIEGTFTYRSNYIYHTLVTNTERNCGFFWEPGMYQGILVIAILQLILEKNHYDISAYWFRIIVLVGTLITTYSTTGYVMIIALTLLFIIDRMDLLSHKFTTIITIFVVALLLLFTGDNFFVNLFIDYMPDIVTSKIVNKNISYNTRMYSLVYDFWVVVQHPLGIGRLALSGTIDKIAMAFGTEIAARTNTIGTAFVHFGVVGGAIYFWFWIKACFSINGCISKRIIIFVIMMVIINTEPHMYTLLFNVILFYWYFQSRTQKKELAIRDTGTCASYL